jgi:hypothetical protein
MQSGSSLSLEAKAHWQQLRIHVGHALVARGRVELHARLVFGRGLASFKEKLDQFPPGSHFRMVTTKLSRRHTRYSLPRPKGRLRKMATSLRYWRLVSRESALHAKVGRCLLFCSNRSQGSSQGSRQKTDNRAR